MLEAWHRLLYGFSMIFVSLSLIVSIALGAAFGARYLEIRKINSDWENFCSDILAYGTMHNGFNDPVDGSYSVNQVIGDYLDKYNLRDKMYRDPVLEPGIGTQALERTTELRVTVYPKVPVGNPLSHDTRELNPKVATSLTHGYVKVRESKPLPTEAPIIEKLE